MTVDENKRGSKELVSSVLLQHKETELVEIEFPSDQSKNLEAKLVGTNQFNNEAFCSESITLQTHEVPPIVIVTLSRPHR
jgi:hypothetical protein